MRGDRACGLCEAVVTPEDVCRERVVLFRSALFCEKCAVPVARLRRETLLFAAKFDRGGAYSCSRCPAPISASELENARFTRWKDELYCSLCSSDLKKLVLKPAAPASVPAADEAVDICAMCSGLVSNRDLASGGAVKVDGETYCKACRTTATTPAAPEFSMDLVPESSEALAPAAAAPAPASEELELALVESSEHAVVKSVKTVKTARVERAPAAVRVERAPTAVRVERAPTAVRVERAKRVETDPSEPSEPDGLTVDLVTQQPSSVEDFVELDDASTKADPAEKTRLDTKVAPRKRKLTDRIEAPVTPGANLDDLLTDDSPVPERPLAPVASSERSESRGAAAKAKKSNSPEKAEAKSDLKGDAKIQVEEFSLDASSPSNPLVSPHAATQSTVSGRTKKSTGPVKTPKSAKPDESIAKLTGDALGAAAETKKSGRRTSSRRSGSGALGAKCPICSAPTGDSKKSFADKTYCSACSVELSEVLAKTKPRTGSELVCAGCEKPAEGDGALMFSLSNVAYCAGCAPQAEPIVESMVRDGMERRRRRARKPLIAVAAVGLVACVGGAFSFLHAESAAPPAAGATAKPAAVAQVEPGEDGEGPAKALVDSFESDVTHVLANTGLTESPLSFEAVGPRERATDKLRVVTSVPHPNGGQGKVRGLVEYSVSEGRLERRLIRWLDEGGGMIEKNAPLSLTDRVVSFKLEWTRGTSFVDPTRETASGAEFAKKALPRALRVIVITDGADGKKHRIEREIAFPVKG